MGEQTFVSESQNTPRPSNRQVRWTVRGIDLPLVLVVLALFAFGLVMIYASSPLYSINVLGQNYDYLFWKQFGLGIMAFGVCAVIGMIDYHKYHKLMVPMMIVIILMLSLVIFGLGEFRNGATRTLFNGSIQPSEMAKLGVIIYLAYWLYSKQDKLNDLTFGLFPLSAILGVVIALIIPQPDYSAAVMIGVLGIMMFFLADGSWKQIGILIVLTGILGAFVLFFTSTGQARVAQWETAMYNPAESVDQVRLSLEAVARGGVFGLGLGNSRSVFYGMPVAPTDSIFAVVAEDTGLIGSIFVVGLFLVLLWRGLVIAKNAPDLLGKMLASGITLWIVMEAFMNMLFVVGIFPVSGNALPFISSGGSNLLTVFAGIGLIMSVSRRSKKAAPQTTEGRSSRAVVDMRRWDRRGSVSRTRRPTFTR